MPKDKRIKGCPNPDCECNRKKHKYTADDRFCTRCGSELVFVCKVCFKKLADEGPQHVICGKCAAERDDRRNDAHKRWANFGENLSRAAKDAGNGVADAAKSTAHAAEKLYVNMAEKLQKKPSEDELNLPKEYVLCKKKLPADLGIPKEAKAFGRNTEQCSALLVAYPVTEEQSMPFDDNAAIIDRLHASIGENEGIIEVGNGTTASGCPYVYDILKHNRTTPTGLPMGMEYTVNLNVKKNDSIRFINGSFAEAGTTGIRDSIGMAMYMKENNIGSMEEAEGWSCDPYDPEFSKGLRMNASERAELDEKFPEHPLSEARKFLRFVAENN